MCAVTPQCHAGGIDGLDRAHRIALDTWNLHHAANRITSHPQIVLHTNFGGILRLRDGAPQYGCERARRHGAGNAHFSLAADLGAGNRRIFLVENPYGRSRQQKINHALFIGAGHEIDVIMQDCGNDSCRPVGRRCHHLATGRVLLIDCQRIQIHPIEHGQGIFQRLMRSTAQLFMQLSGATLDMKKTRQTAGG